MYTNLKSTLRQKGLTVKQYAAFLGVSEKTIQNKLNGRSEFTYPEFKKTCSFLLPEYNADYLFSNHEKTKGELYGLMQIKKQKNE